MKRKKKLEKDDKWVIFTIGIYLAVNVLACVSCVLCILVRKDINAALLCGIVSCLSQILAFLAIVVYYIEKIANKLLVR